MITQALKFLTEPRLWVGAGLALAAFGLVHGYVEDHAAASRVIAHQEEMIDPVFAQAFDPQRHIGANGHTNILGEADFASSHVIDTRDRRRFFVLPLQSVSEGGRRAARLRMIEVIQQGADPGPHRPVARPKGVFDASPRMLLVFEMAELADTPGAFSDIGLHELGTGFYGTVVQVFGAFASQGDTSQSDPMAAPLEAFHALYGVPVVVPAAIGDADAAAASRSKGMAMLQVKLGLIIAAIGFFVLIKGHRYFERRLSRAKTSPIEQDTAPASPNAFFVPIASQGSIASEEGRRGTFEKMPWLEKLTRKIWP